MGAGVAVRFALSRPDLVQGIVLVRPAWLDKPMPENLRLFPYVAELLGRMEPQDALSEFLSTRKSELKDIAVVSRAALKSLCRQFTQPRSVERLVRLQRMPASSPIMNWHEVRGLTMPVMVVGNERDPMHPYEFAEAWAQHIDRAELVKIPSQAASAAKHQAAFRIHFQKFLSSLERDG